MAISAGAEIAGEFLQHRDRPDPATLIGKGKLEEIAGATASVSADLLLFDHDLTASQQRNIEKLVNTRVIDRTQLILDIFAKHARTREGQLQVELAQLEYMLPRLGGRGIEMSQLGGGIGTRGPGETQLETDRRKIHRRVRHVKEQIENVRRVRGATTGEAGIGAGGDCRAGRLHQCGEVTLFNALTRAAVLESPRMFATLDPTIRSVTLPSRRQALLSDTVGFIRNLPHTLVSAFRATLEEVQRASLVLQVSDASSPLSVEQDAQVDKVLKELEADGKPRLRVMNKIDLLPPKQRESLRDDANRVHVSAAKGIGMSTLLDRIDEMLSEDPIEPGTSARAPKGRKAAGAAGGALADLFARVQGGHGGVGSGGAGVGGEEGEGMGGRVAQAGRRFTLTDTIYSPILYILRCSYFKSRVVDGYGKGQYQAGRAAVCPRTGNALKNSPRTTRLLCSRKLQITSFALKGEWSEATEQRGRRNMGARNGAHAVLAGAIPPPKTVSPRRNIATGQMPEVGALTTGPAH